MYTSKCSSTYGHIHSATCAMIFEAIPVPRALLPKLVDLLKEKVRIRILEPSMAPYSN